uniref:C2H2-type domain-containing protein n=1 Tax=Gouania willdenowi TaxID=441366 RepID=A0A8C5HTR6_GOUWI
LPTTDVHLSPDDVRSHLLPPDHSYPSLKALEAEPAEGKMVILLEDFYYGSALGQKTIQPRLQSRTNIGLIRCSICSKTLSNNISSDSVCPHCFRHFLTAAKLQSHVHEVHTRSDSTVTCRICELCFGSEPNLLSHMRTNHRPGEMPYTCQVCDFRTSSYSDVWTHFEQLHANTRNLLCHYCLRVLTSNTCYQQHHALHQRSFNLTCHRCRLHFLFVGDRIKHEVIHHRTHINPAQLSGLKPGTKVRLCVSPALQPVRCVECSQLGDRLQPSLPVCGSLLAV